MVEFAAGRQDEGDQARAFLDAPWELLARAGEHWGLRQDILFCPVRRFGSPLPPREPSPYRLSLVFMAAAPRGASDLSYEAEESAILAATQDLGLDLFVEESGTLDLLAVLVAREGPDVIHVSCHGRLKPEPGLLLEDDVGDPAFVAATHLVSKIASCHPRLLFLSACETAESSPVLDSLARSLVRSGAPAVMGWAARVPDAEATLFASGFYRRLTEAHALAYARFDLTQSKRRDESRSWHMARLYLSPTGGGQAAAAGGPRRRVGYGRAAKAFLDARGQVPVAGEQEFVGRRREIQRILAAFRVPDDQRSSGILIHGMGRQGKSSLAARVACRLAHSHETIVLYGRYDAPAILAAFRPLPAAAELVNRCLPQVEEHPSDLLPALVELLSGPCRQEVKDEHGRAVSRPVLLVIDDFEQALVAQPAGIHSLKPELVAPIAAVIRAFDRADSDSRLLS